MLMTPASPSPASRTRRHRRSTSGSAFDDCSAFGPLPNIPRRARTPSPDEIPTPASPRVKKAAFVVGGSSEEDDDDCPLVREVNQRARLRDEHFGDFSYDAEAHRAKSQVAFPVSSPQQANAPLPLAPLTIPDVARSASSPSLTAPKSSPPGLSSVSSTNSFNSGASTPIYLKNGRPLKPSLKSRVSLSVSTPDVATMMAHAKSAPTTPRVHFPTRERLESVVLFDKRARPLEVAAGDSPIASPAYFEDGPGLRIRPLSSFPFPSVPRQPNLQGLSAALMAKTKLKIAVSRSAPLQPNPHPEAKVHFAAVRLLATRLSGSVLVKNISFNKRVSIRYTFDNWETTSEVSAAWSSPNALADLPKGEPKSFGEEETELDVARGILVAVPNGWDRFTFNIKLDDVAPYLSARSMLVAVKFEASGAGEWWDNCGGLNYRFEFDHVPRKEVKEEPKFVGRPRSNTSPAPLATDTTIADPPSASLLSAKLSEVQIKAPSPVMPTLQLNPPTPDAKTPTPESKTPKPVERPALKLQFPSDKTITPALSPLGSDLGAEMAAPKLIPRRETKPLTPPDSTSSSPRGEPTPLPPAPKEPSLPSPAESPASKRQSPLPSPSAVEAPAHSTTNVKDQSYADFLAKYCFAGAQPSSTGTGHTRSASYSYGTSVGHAAPTHAQTPNFGWGSNTHAPWGNVGFNYGTSFSGGDY